MRQLLLGLLFCLAGCTAAPAPPPDLTPQHACWIQVPNPLDHDLIMDRSDTFLLGVESDRDVTLSIRFMVVNADEIRVADETMSVAVYRAIPAEVRLPVIVPHRVPRESRSKLSLRVRVLGQSVQAAVRLRVSCLGLTISDPSRRREQQSGAQDSPAPTPADPAPIVEREF